MITKKLALEIYLQYYAGTPFTQIKPTIINLQNAIEYTNSIFIGYITGNIAENGGAITVVSRQPDGVTDLSVVLDFADLKPIFIKVPVICSSMKFAPTLADNGNLSFVGYQFKFQ